MLDIFVWIAVGVAVLFIIGAVLFIAALGKGMSR